jgi:hypothetical protein
MINEERRAKASREARLRLVDTDFCPGELGSISSVYKSNDQKAYEIKWYIA